MPHVNVTSPDIALDRVVDDLRRQLGDRYKVTVPRETGRIKVETSPLVYANVHVKQQGDGARFSVHGGGVLVGRVINEYTIARKVATALRTSPALAPRPSAAAPSNSASSLSALSPGGLK